MAQTSNHRHWASYFKEVTPCIAPADWNTEGTAIEFTSLDLAGLKQTILDNPTLERRVLSVNKRIKIGGLRNCEFGIGLKLHGTGVTTADGVVVTQTYLGDQLEHCMGGVHLGMSTTCLVGSTNIIPILDDVTGVEVGQMLAFQDTTSPVPQYTGKPVPRRVIDVDVGTGAVTLSEKLPFVPVAGDVVHGGITGHIDEFVLEDAVAAGATQMWFLQRHKTDDAMTWQVEGSVASFSVTGLSRGQLPGMDLKVMAANFKHGGVDGLSCLTLPNPQGQAQLSCGKDIRCSIAPASSTDPVWVDVSQVGFDVGFSRERVETTTENIERFEGTASYTLKPGNTRFTVTVPQYDDSWYLALASGIEYRITFYQPGDGSGAGKLWCIHLPKCQLVETPARSDTNENNAVSLVFEAMESDDTGDVDTELAKSLFYIFIA